MHVTLATEPNGDLVFRTQYKGVLLAALIFLVLNLGAVVYAVYSNNSWAKDLDVRLFVYLTLCVIGYYALKRNVSRTCRFSVKEQQFIYSIIGVFKNAGAAIPISELEKIVLEASTREDDGGIKYRLAVVAMGKNIALYDSFYEDNAAMIAQINQWFIRHNQAVIQFDAALS